MNKIKLIAALVISIITISVFCAMPAFALTEGDWEFQLLDNEVYITGYLGKGGDVVIPETIYGCPVTRVSCTESGKTLADATSISFPSGVKVIESNTRAGSTNTNTKKVILPEGVEKIDSYAFQGWEALEQINLPSTLKIIKNDAFRYCAHLNHIIFPDALAEIQREAFYGTALETVDLSRTSAAIGYGVFSNNKNLKTVRLPANLTKIPGSLFEGCTSLTDIEIPAKVETIGSSAFRSCESLESIILPVSLKEIESYTAFTGCNSLKEVVIPYGTKAIGDRAFSQCINLKSVYIPDTVTSIGILDIIEDSPNAIIYCTQNSKAAKYCKEKNISYLTDTSVNSGITVLYNGTRISFHSYGQNPELLNSRTLVPLRSIFEAMGAEVEWDNATSTAIARRNGIEIKIQIGANEMYKDGKAIAVDVPAQLMNSRTMVPVRVIAEAFGADVQWNENGNTVLINE